MTIIDCGNCNGRCCRNYRIALCPLDIINIQKTTGLNPIDFIELESVDNMWSMFPDVFIDKNYYYLTLRRQKDERCIFAREIENRKLTCSIHGNHPLACRLYPFKLTIDNRVAKRGDVDCHGIFEKKKIDGELKILQEAIHHEIHFFEQKAHDWNKSGGGTIEELMKYIIISDDLFN